MKEPLAERISNDDFNEIVDWVANLPDFDTESDRRAAYLQPAFVGRVGGDTILRDAKIRGDRPTAASALVHYFLREYGAIADQVYSLGVFLAHATSRSRATAAEMWRLIDAYGMLDGDPALAAKLRPAAGRSGARGRESSNDVAWRGPDLDEAGFERLLNALPELAPGPFAANLQRVSRSVAKLEVRFPQSTGTGTAFLIAPDLLLTCYHVLFDKDRGFARAETATAWFDFETDGQDQPRSVTTAAADVTSIVGDKDHDWAAIRLATPMPEDRTPLLLSSRMAEYGERAIILQHAGGRMMSVDLGGGGAIQFVDDDVVQYLLNTEKGSSGAPVLNDRWEVVALHHYGLPRRKLFGRWCNQGINIVRVREGLVGLGLLPAGPSAPRSREESRSTTFVVDALDRGDEGLRDPSPADYLPPVLRPIRDAVLRDGADAMIDAGVIASAVRHAATDWESYRLQRIAHWKQPKYDRKVDSRFTRLTLMLDQGQGAQGERWAERDRFDDLRKLLGALEGRFSAVVVLGVPGVGKTTLLRRLELDWAIDGLRQPDAAPLTFMVSLGEYRSRERTPRAWLAERWARAYPHLPSFEKVLETERIVLLLDALNEMPHTGPTDYAERVQAWRAAIETLASERPGVRAVFTCRRLDYSASLSTDDCQVPHVQVEALNDEQVRLFLSAYLADPTRADAVWTRLQAAPALLDLCRTPYYLSLLTSQVEPGGDLPGGRAALFTGFVRHALKREADAEHRRFDVGPLLSERDRRRIDTGRSGWRTAYALPDEGALIPALEVLADSMQRMGKSDDGSQVSVSVADAAAGLAADTADDVLDAGADLGVLDIDKLEDSVRFAHQLMQEYFAARVLARRREPELLRAPWRANEVAERLADTMKRISEADPLPPLPPTGWEETAIIAAEMMAPADADANVAALADVNLIAAARCATAADVPVTDTRRTAVRKAVARRMTDPSADLRARIAAGLALGDFGDPVDLGFKRCEGPHGAYLLPPLVAIPAGTYAIGSNDHWAHERPAHGVPLPGFEIGRFPVTNAEYRCFVEAGGYGDERWWETNDARHWLRGDAEFVEAIKEPRRVEWAAYPKDDAAFAEWCSVRPNLTQSSIDWIEWFRMLSSDELESQLDRWYPSGESRTAPSLWDSSEFNSPLQPVVGVCWYEACAYNRWLRVQTRLPVTLPSEVQHEAAARGASGRAYAYGPRHDHSRSNTYEAHVRRSTPVGVLPGGSTPEGVVDLSGNVYEWTRSLWGTEANGPDAEFRYPYDPLDPVREDKNAGPTCLRVVRGGCWGDFHGGARAAYRGWSLPAARGGSLGFRLVVSSPIS